MTTAAAESPLVARLLRGRHITEADVPALGAQTTTRLRYLVTEIRVGGTPRYVAKAARNPAAVPLLHHEARVLGWVGRASPQVSAPRVLQGPLRDRWLLTTHLGAAAAWSVHGETATQLAALLADLHLSRTAETSPRPAHRLPPSGVPTLLLPQLSGAAAHDSGTAGAMAYLQRWWIGGAAIHGDVKWEHVRGEQQPGLIDWELGGVGDPAWDVASLLHELCVLGETGAGLGRCLAAYAARLRRPLSRGFLLRCTAALSVRFVQSTHEYAQGGADGDRVGHSRQQSRWWAAHPRALDACLSEAA